MARDDAYQWLAEQFGIPKDVSNLCHIGPMTATQCLQVEKLSLEFLATKGKQVSVATEPTKADKVPWPRPGIYEGIDFEEYLKWDAISNSTLKFAAKSMAHYKAHIDGRLPFPTSEAMKLGSFLHCGKLEPMALIDRYIVMPDFSRDPRNVDAKGKPSDSKNTTAYKALVEEFAKVNAGKEIVPAEAIDVLKGVSFALAANKRASEWLNAPGPVELSIVWIDPETGLTCKARLDKMIPGKQLLVDFKSTREVDRFQKQLYDLSYYRQAAFYSSGMAELTDGEWGFGFIAAETSEPFTVCAAPVDEEAIEAGRNQHRRLLRQIAHCRETGKWPSIPNPAFWSLPAYAETEGPVDLFIGGELVRIAED